MPDVRFALDLGGVLTDISDDVLLEDGARHARGRRAEGSSVDASTADLTLKNGAKYNRRNPNSPYSGLLGPNTPLHVSTFAGETVLDVPYGVAGRASTPDHASLDITGDIDVRVELEAAAWAGRHTANAWEVAGKYVTTGNNRSWQMLIGNSGAPHFRWSPDGTITNAIIRDAETVVPFGPGAVGAVRATLDVNNGSGGWTLSFYVAPTLAGPWVLLEDPIVTTAGTTSVFASTAPLDIGDTADLGFGNVGRRFRAAEIRSGIDGTIVAAPNFLAQASGATSFADSAGRTWTVANGATITDRRSRAVLGVPEWSPRWHQSGHHVRTPIQASGILRRLGQGAKALDSALRRRMPSFNPVAYWPMEDGREAVQAYSPTIGVAPMRVTGLEMAGDDSLPSSKPLPVIGTASSIKATVPAHSASGWHLEFAYRLDDDPGSLQTLMEWTISGSPWKIWRLRVGNNLMNLIVEDGEGATTLVLNAPSTGLFGTGWGRYLIQATPNGSNLDLHSAWITLGAGGYQSNGTLNSTSAGRITGINTRFGAGLDGASIGHLVVFGNDDTETFSSADSGFTGERAGVRVERLCSEESIPARVAGFSTEQEKMGPQLPTTILDLLAECEATDGGILLEDRDRAALVYRGRSSMYNQTPRLTLPYSQLAPPMEPVDDDRLLRNQSTVRRDGGSWATEAREDGPLSIADPPDGAGLYDQDVTLSLASDDQCQRIAGWLTHRGTWDESRYPSITLRLHSHPDLVADTCRVDVGDVIRVTDLPSWLPPGDLDLLVEGYEETWGPFSWEITFACSPAGIWTVNRAAAGSRNDTAGTELAVAVDADDTTLVVDVHEGPLWTTDAEDCPLTVTVDGEDMTATAITGDIEDQYTRTVTSGWGTASSGQTWTLTGGSNSEYSVQGV
ncbi:hypothetical protein [Streptomyces sp. NPDC101132]|uniref:hypothetical protein n=1 Tax=Streptomyces sp. NPDC101132 TaxID=3366110 RepID=UPI0038119C58